MLLDTARITMAANAAPFRVFHLLWHGADAATVKRLHLGAIEAPFFAPLTADEEKMAARAGWSLLETTFAALNVDVAAIANGLAAILHLLHANATTNVATRASFVRARNAECAAQLLGSTTDELATAIFRGYTPVDASTR